ncbi:hypothetical protein BDV93DRAFT_605071 [Ceratobasidium sp. AG-I]|nr:hypothetical protein BDV93DRAFT_605071 [Ceratobasidium sp. AG-I]
MISARYRRVLVCVSLFFSSRAASQQPVKIDDASIYSPMTPNRIQFSPTPWNTTSQERAEIHYGGTYTWSREAGANLLFFFRGTAIAFYAEQTAQFGPVAVLIDGQSTNAVQWAKSGDSRYQQQIWNVTGLSQGDHQVLVSNVGTDDPLTGVLGLDYLEVTPGEDGVIIPASSGPGASVIPPNAVLVDDSSDMINYTGPSWQVLHSGTVGGIYLDETQRSSTSPGAAINFTFYGTAVVSDIVNTASMDDAWLSQMIIWSKTGLRDGPHTVIITHTGLNGTYISVDFFKYMPSTPVTTSASAAKSKSAPIGAIVGGVVCGFAVIALIFGIGI